MTDFREVVGLGKLVVVSDADSESGICYSLFSTVASLALARFWFRKNKINLNYFKAVVAFRGEVIIKIWSTIHPAHMRVETHST